MNYLIQHVSYFLIFYQQNFIKDQLMIYLILYHIILYLGLLLIQQHHHHHHHHYHYHQVHLYILL
ncbi:unnamed protein product [Schistosoma mattheei]|uniref:Uncharacterized protein n=1 Tax=Schistosoma mattheei TaxID=31246 RepID=A0A3P8HJ02_9TREM|nr:unnamed protein product [Schistosoma mattheei]